MNIFDATLKLKDFFYNGNQQLIKINGKVEMSGFSPLPILFYSGKKIEDYDKCTQVIKSGNFLYDPKVKSIHRNIKDKFQKIIPYEELTPQVVDTKEYWNFLHENFQYCDVCSYFRATDLDTYFAIKGPHYDSIIREYGIDIFKNKKILEIGPGYGYLPKILKEMNIPHQYYCADIVRRFDHDNFIDVSGYTLSNITEKFDVIIMVDVIQHLGSDIFKTYTKEIKDMLNWDGKLIIDTCMRETEDFYGRFFGQTYFTLGHENMRKYMTSELNFIQNFKYSTVNNQIISIIFEYTKI